MSKPQHRGKVRLQSLRFRGLGQGTSGIELLWASSKTTATWVKTAHSSSEVCTWASTHCSLVLEHLRAMCFIDSPLRVKGLFVLFFSILEFWFFPCESRVPLFFTCHATQRSSYSVSTRVSTNRSRIPKRFMRGASSTRFRNLLFVTHSSNVSEACHS